MSAERHHEHQERHNRVSADLEAARIRKLEELRNQESDAADNPKEHAEKAREIIHKHEQAPNPSPDVEVQPPRPHAPVLNYHVNFQDTMASMQRKLDPTSRAFSKVIHQPAIEKTSELLASTIARPSVTLGSTWTALIVGSVFYFTARHFGYMLSGSELMFSFVVGALLGVVIEGIWRSLRRH